MSKKTKDIVISVILFSLVLMVAAMFVKYFSTFMVSLGMAKAAATSLAKLIVAVAMFVGYTALKEKLLNDNLNKVYDSSAFQDMMRRSVNARRGHHGF